MSEQNEPEPDDEGFETEKEVRGGREDESDERRIVHGVDENEPFPTERDT